VNRFLVLGVHPDAAYAYLSICPGHRSGTGCCCRLLDTAIRLGVAPLAPLPARRRTSPSSGQAPPAPSPNLMLRSLSRHGDGPAGVACFAPRNRFTPPCRAAQAGWVLSPAPPPPPRERNRRSLSPVRWTPARRRPTLVGGLVLSWSARGPAGDHET